MLCASFAVQIQVGQGVHPAWSGPGGGGGSALEYRVSNCHRPCSLAGVYVATQKIGLIWLLCMHRDISVTSQETRRKPYRQMDSFAGLTPTSLSC